MSACVFASEVCVYVHRYHGMPNVPVRPFGTMLLRVLTWKYRSAPLAFEPSGFKFSTELLQFPKDYCRGFVCVTSVVMRACVECRSACMRACVRACLALDEAAAAAAASALLLLSRYKKQCQDRKKGGVQKLFVTSNVLGVYVPPSLPVCLCLARPPSFTHLLTPTMAYLQSKRSCLTSVYDVTVPDENAIRYLSAERQFESVEKPRLD